MHILEEYKTKEWVSGDLHAIMYRENPAGEVIEILKEEEWHNLIVAKASELMAGLMKPSRTLLGIEWLAAGTGFGNGTLQAPQVEQSNQQAMRNEIFRKAITSNTLVANILTLVTTFNETEAVGALVELGLFGGNASATAGSGYMFNHKAFAVWNKPGDAKLTITWTITF